jgi:hypothetical protein
MRRTFRTAGAGGSLFAVLAIVLLLSTAGCLFDGHGDHHGAPAHDLCAGLVAIAMVAALTLMLETLGCAYAIPGWAMVTATGFVLDPPPRSILH